jgi:hypothetical protein
MTPLPHESWVVLTTAGVGLAVVQTARLWWRGAALRWRLRKQAAHAAAGEVRAEKLLARAGYRIDARQAVTSWTVRVGGAEQPVQLRCDFVVTRRGRRYVAEVKTGQEAPDIGAPATRRQLLEYRCAFAVDGVLLVDAEAGRVHTVDFTLPATVAPALRAIATAFAAGLVFGAALLAALFRSHW